MEEDITNATKACDICLGTGRQLLEQTQHQPLREHPKAWKIPHAGSPGEEGIRCLSPPLTPLGCHVTVGYRERQRAVRPSMELGEQGWERRHRGT